MNNEWVALATDFQRLPVINTNRLCSELHIKQQPQDFIVIEVPQYRVAGYGEHLYLWIRKCCLSGEELLRRISRALKLDSRKIGLAGTKDKWAVAYQWVSVPRQYALGIDRVTDQNLAILDRAFHTKKLKVGHLRGNRFILKLLCPKETPTLSGLTEAVRLLNHRGLPNLFGYQRFGTNASTLLTGLKFLADPDAAWKRKHFPAWRRLAISAVQSAVFNFYLYERAKAGLLYKVLPGDVVSINNRLVLCESDSDCKDLVTKRQAVITGPIIGVRMFRPRSESLEFEEMVLQKVGIGPQDFAPFERIAKGTRRPLIVYPQSLEFMVQPTGVELSFFLPAGSYATVLLREFAPKVVDLSSRRKEPGL